MTDHADLGDLSPGKPLPMATPWTSSRWADYFRDNALHLGAIPWEGGMHLTPAERDAIAAAKYFLAPQVKRLKSILAKVEGHPPVARAKRASPHPDHLSHRDQLVEQRRTVARHPRAQQLPRAARKPAVSTSSVTKPAISE